MFCVYYIDVVCQPFVYLFFLKRLKTIIISEFRVSVMLAGNSNDPAPPAGVTPLQLRRRRREGGSSGAASLSFVLSPSTQRHVYGLQGGSDDFCGSDCQLGGRGPPQAGLGPGGKRTATGEIDQVAEPSLSRLLRTQTCRGKVQNRSGSDRTLRVRVVLWFNERIAGDPGKRAGFGPLHHPHLERKMVASRKTSQPEVRGTS